MNDEIEKKPQAPDSEKQSYGCFVVLILICLLFSTCHYLNS